MSHWFGMRGVQQHFSVFLLAGNRIGQDTILQKCLSHRLFSVRLINFIMCRNDMDYMVIPRIMSP